MKPDDEIAEFYESLYDESSRGDSVGVQIEFARTQEIIGRFLTSPALRIADIGGGPGTHATWLAGDGHTVTLVDPVARHVESASRIRPDRGSITALVGDARALSFDDGAFDAVLLLGPLYHLLEAADRSRALAEAWRVLLPGGVLFAGAISRFAAYHDGLATQRWFDARFRAIATEDLASGQHRNPDRDPGWFTAAYFHRVDDLRSELQHSGFVDEVVYGLEGLVGWLPDLQGRWANDADRAILMDGLRAVETEPTLLGVSAHLLGVGRKPA